MRQASAERPAGRSYSTARVFARATVAGLLLGPLDLIAQTTLPYPWANLANSGAVWALAAFILGTTVRRVAMGAVAGLLLLPIAVESYYLAAVIFRHDSSATLWDDVAMLWLALAIVVGPLFGLAGAAVHSKRRGVRLAATFCAGAIFVLEALVRFGRSPGDGGSNHTGQTALIEIVLAVVVPVVALALTRGRR